MNESNIITTSVTEAFAERGITMLDIPGAYLHANNDKHTITLLKGKLTELLI